jgi:hypothetical protein
MRMFIVLCVCVESTFVHFSSVEQSRINESNEFSQGRAGDKDSVIVD